MSPIDYLRDMVKRGRKPATGGVITADQAPVIASGCVHPGPGYLMPTPAPAPQPPRDPSWENASRIVATCTCEPTLYSRCYCDRPPA